MKTERINFWLSPEERKLIDDKREKYNFVSISEYIRFVALNANIEVNIKK